MTGDVGCVSFQGAPGAFSEEATLRLAPDAQPIPRSSFEEVVRAVESGADEVGVLPVENTLAGTVTEAYDALVHGVVRVVAEATIPIRHLVLGAPGASLDRLGEVRSHPVALAQCRQFLSHHPGIRARAVYDTAGAAEEIAALGDPGVAAIASRRAADRYGLEILAGDVQDRADNQTRFYLIAPRASAPPSVTDERCCTEPERAGRRLSPADAAGGPSGDHSPGAQGTRKTSLVVELENRAGSLHELLGVFARGDLSLTHVTSRPAPTPWTYRFVVELEHVADDEIDAAVDEARALATELRMLGTFPTLGPADRGLRGGAGPVASTDVRNTAPT